MRRISEAETRKELIDSTLERANWNLKNHAQAGLEIPVDGYDKEPWNGVTDYCLYRQFEQCSHRTVSVKWRNGGNIKWVPPQSSSIWGENVGKIYPIRNLGQTIQFCFIFDAAFGQGVQVYGC